MRMSIIVEDLRPPLDEGAKKTSFNLIRSFAKTGVDVSVFTQYETPFPGDVAPLPRNKLLLGYNFIRDLRLKSPDLVLYIPASSGTLGAFARAATLKTLSGDAPLGLLNLQFRKLPGSIRHLGVHRCADVVFAQSNASATALASLGFNTILLAGGVDSTIFRPVDEKSKRVLRAKYRLSDSSPIILHVGHVKHGRNVLALAGLVEKGYQVVLVAGTSVGIDGTLLDDLRRSGVTVVTSFVENIQEFYQLADVYVFPVFNAVSAIDAPLSVLEAMACNLPVVTTRFGALPSMFPSGNGLYFFDEQEDVVPLVERAVENRDCMTSEAVSRYSWDNLAATILKAFEQGGNGLSMS